MKKKILIKEVPIEEALKVNASITEFVGYSKEYFEERTKGKEKLIIVALLNNHPVGYMVSYDKFSDGSFYCWMTGVNPGFRRKGILKSMMSYLERWAKKHHHKKIRIKTRNNRREMLSYLIKYGFDVIEVTPYPVIEDNRVLFEKEI